MGPCMAEALGASALRAALAPPVARRSLMVAVVVGTVLNAINQGDVIAAGGTPDWLKIALTYCVPFCVATYGAYCAATMAQDRS